MEVNKNVNPFVSGTAMDNSVRFNNTKTNKTKKKNNKWINKLHIRYIRNGGKYGLASWAERQVEENRAALVSQKRKDKL